MPALQITVDDQIIPLSPRMDAMIRQLLTYKAEIDGLVSGSCELHFSRLQVEFHLRIKRGFIKLSPTETFANGHKTGID